MIDLEQARELIAKAVETQGRDFVYNPGGGRFCYYEPTIRDGFVDPDDPMHKTGCLVGTALTIAGETFHLKTGRDDFVAGSITVIAPKGALTKDATDYFLVAQRVQDNGGTWGEAQEKAEEFVASGLGVDAFLRWRLK